MSTDPAATRRIAALQQARAQDTARKRQAVLDTLQRLAGNGIRVTFESVARRAGVSRQFLYADAELRTAVEGARRRTPPLPRHTAPDDSDGARADQLLAREEIKRLRAENTKLKAKLVEQVADSQLASDDDAIRELTVRNAELVREAAALRRELTTAQEDLDAARDTNRELMTEINRRQPRRD